MALKNINKENKEKLALKREGHLLIDKIKWRGYSKDTVYMMLAKEMKVEERHAHFSVMNSLRELRKAIEALRLLEKKTPKTEAASVDWHESVPIKSIKIIRFKEQKPVRITLPQPPKAPKKKKQKAGNIVLPRSAYADTLREVAEANSNRKDNVYIAQGRLDEAITVHLSTPKKSWVYNLFMKIYGRER